MAEIWKPTSDPNPDALVQPGQVSSVGSLPLHRPGTCMDWFPTLYGIHVSVI